MRRKDTLSVIIPSYRRPTDLERCTRALLRQSRLPDEVIVVMREGDVETAEVLRRMNQGERSVRCVHVKEPGVVAALNAGINAASGDILAFTDDDTEPLSDWCERIVDHLTRDTKLGAVGGRDIWYVGGVPQDAKAEAVGLVQWWGRYIGNHHLGYGRPRPVDILKGANMSFRRKAVGELRFDERLRGGGAQVACDLQFCLRLRRRGWTLLYDPATAVYHHLGTRHDDDKRQVRSPEAQSNAAHNQTLALLEFLAAWQRPVFFVWAIAVGTREVPGLIQGIRLLLLLPNQLRPNVRATLMGRVDGLRTWLRSQ